MDGILVINKATGMTSHDVVARVRKVLKQRRVGHAGTLDPAASGVLPICVGQATRVAEYLSESGKAYEAVITFGIVTDTYDAEGSITRTSDTSALTIEQISAVLPHFIGPQQQMPPRYSAIKIQGQPAYKRMRAGEEVIVEPRAITISHLRVLDWHTPHLTLAVECSKGTYIRSLAYDLGEALSCGAYLSALVRTRSGPFTLADSITLEQLAAEQETNTLTHGLFSADAALRDYPALVLDEATTARVLHGNAFHITASPLPSSTLARVYNHEQRLIAIAAWDEQQKLWQPHKVFSE